MNDNLRDKKFRCDNVHLTDRGVSRLANNLKYKFAAALDITVSAKKNVAEKRYNSHVYGDRDDRNWNRYDNGDI